MVFLSRLEHGEFKIGLQRAGEPEPAIIALGNTAEFHFFRAHQTCVNAIDADGQRGAKLRGAPALKEAAPIAL